MKKITLFFLLLSVLSVTETFAQSDFYTCIPSDNSTSGNARAPHGRFRYQRGVILIKATEMTTSGIVNTDVINSIAFNYLAAQDIPTNATMTLYMQNTTDATNLKSLTWATAITGMTTVRSGAVTFPATAGNVSFDFTTNFTYTGGGVYVAFDYQNAANPLPTVFASVDCNSTGLAGGFKGAQSDAAVQTAITASNFRPVILLGKSVTCARPVNLGFNTPTLNSANLTFDVTSGGTVDLEYGAYGYTQGTGGTSVTNITSPYTLTGLTPSTTYDYYVRKNCGGSYSAWAGPYPFHTAFQPTNPTYNTGFEQEDFPYIGWLAIPDNTANSWFINFAGTGNALVQEGASSAIAITPTATAASESLYSRGINLTAGSTATITYYDRNYVSTTAPISTNTASYILTVGTTQEATSQTTTLNTTTGLSTTSFSLRTFTYTVPSTGTYYFRFQNTSPANATGTHALIIDNFTVSETLGVNEFLNSKFALYPNPTTGIVNLSNTIDATINSVEILDLNGRLINNVKINSENQVNISDLSKGVYMMKIISDEGTAIKKVIKE